MIVLQHSTDFLSIITLYNVWNYAFVNIQYLVTYKFALFIIEGAMQLYLIYVSTRLGYQRRYSLIPRKMLLIIFVTRQLILISRCAVFAQIMRNQIIGMYLLPDKSQQGRIANPAAPSDSSIIRGILIAMCDVFYFAPFAILLR